MIDSLTLALNNSIRSSLAVVVQEIKTKLATRHQNNYTCSETPHLVPRVHDETFRRHSTSNKPEGANARATQLGHQNGKQGPMWMVSCGKLPQLLLNDALS